MRTKVKGGKHKFLSHHGLIKLSVIDALEILQHPISWANFVDMDRLACLEVQEEINKPKMIATKKRKGKEVANPSKIRKIPWRRKKRRQQPPW